jgi:hypothetical protein
MFGDANGAIYVERRADVRHVADHAKPDMVADDDLDRK